MGPKENAKRRGAKTVSEVKEKKVFAAKLSAKFKDIAEDLAAEYPNVSMAVLLQMVTLVDDGNKLFFISGGVVEESGGPDSLADICDDPIEVKGYKTRADDGRFRFRIWNLTLKVWVEGLFHPFVGKRLY